MLLEKYSVVTINIDICIFIDYVDSIPGAFPNLGDSKIILSVLNKILEADFPY